MLTTAAAHRVAPTLLSRCQRLRFIPLTSGAVEEILSREAADVCAEDREAAAAYCEGSVRRALDLLEGERISDLRGMVETLLGAADVRGVRVIFDAAGEAGRDRNRISDALDLLRLRLRDGLLSLEGLGPKKGSPADPAPGQREGLLRRLRAVDRAQAAVRRNVNPALTLENLVFELRGV